MRKLQRPPEPTSMQRLRKQNSSWDGLAHEDRQLIKNELLKMVERGGKHFCSYCEKEVNKDSSHIEHLVARQDNPNKTYEWANLYLSCKTPRTCGQYKDSRTARPYNVRELIRPDADDPDEFLRFSVNGEVYVPEGLSIAGANRANETIRVLNLNEPRLRAARKNTVAQAGNFISEYLDELEQLTEQERVEFFEDELQAFEGSPFYTAVRHFFMSI